VKCSKCGTEHQPEDIELTYRRPDDIAAMGDEVRLKEVQENDDLCRTRSGRHFVRVVMPFPVEGWDHPYQIGLWVELSRASFERILELWSDPDQQSEPPFEAKIANSIWGQPASLGVKAELRLTGPQTRPAVYVSSEAHHGLHLEQCRGITAHRAHEYSARVS
jgi:hypothetical protein